MAKSKATEDAEAAFGKLLAPPTKLDYLSFGSTLVNLACSGTINGALCKGKYFWMCGASSTGKTYFSLGILAEAANNPAFDEYDLLFEDCEKGALMDIGKHYGKKLESRLKAMRYVNGEPDYPVYLEQFYTRVQRRLSLVEEGKKKPFICILDSMDVLSTLYEEKKMKEKETELEGGAKAKEDYGDGKAKINSRWLRKLMPKLEKTGSILVIISQLKDNVGGGIFDPKEVASGGRALKYYAAWQLWSTFAGKIEKEINGTPRQIGVKSRVAIKKNRLSGKEWVVTIPIYWSTGVDEIGSLVDFLVEENHWEKEGNSISATDFDVKLPRVKLIRYIEENNLEGDLKLAVLSVWREIESQCVVERKPRYE